MDLNFNIAYLFSALAEFSSIVRDLHKKTDMDEFERKRIKAAMALAKEDIEKLFDQVKGE